MLFYVPFQVDFLRYSQQWKKKVVFVLNKADIYQNNNEVYLCFMINIGYYPNVIVFSCSFVLI